MMCKNYIHKIESVKYMNKNNNRNNNNRNNNNRTNGNNRMWNMRREV